MFSEYLTGYDFWGHCDIDLLWGNIRRFVTDEKLKKYKKLYTAGACVLYKNDPVQMKLSGKYYDVGIVKDVEVMPKDAIPFNFKGSISTQYAYKVDFIVNLPGLILPEFVVGSAIKDDGKSKLRIVSLDDSPLQYPKQDSPYTIVEPMRLSDFMDWQYKAAETLTETNKKINDILTDQVIIEIRKTIANVESLSLRSNATLDKVDTLLDQSQADIDELLGLTRRATEDFSKLSANVNTIIGDPIQASNDVVVIPVSKVSFGFAAGGSEFKGETPQNYLKKHENLRY